jgi:hypothetical protein
MTRRSPTNSPIRSARDPGSIPGFASVIRGLAHVPKAEVDAAIAKEKAGKKHQRKRK